MDKKQTLDQQFETWEEEKASLLFRLKEAEKAQTKLEAKLAANQKILDVKENVIFLSTQKLQEKEESLKKTAAQVQEQEQTIKVLEEQIDILKDYLRDAKQKRFGRSSEKFPLPLFSFMKDAIFNEEPKDGNAEPQAEDQEKTKEKKPRGKRKSLPENLPRRKEILDLKDNEKVCDCCGLPLHKITEEPSEQIEVIPEQIIVKQTIRVVYGCKGCKKVKSPALPNQLIPKSLATPSLLSYIMNAKYCDHIPFYRQEEIWKRYGIDLDQSTLARWALTVGEKVGPLIELMRRDILTGDYIQADETTVKVLKGKEKGQNSKGYMWVYKTGGNKPSAIVYKYTDTREGENAEDFLNGWRGYLQTDAYGGYMNMENKEIVHSGCMSHGRRKFADIVKTTKQKDTLAHQAIIKIAGLYKIEEEIKDLTPDERKRIRDEKAVPILDQYKKWLDHYAGKVPPKSPIGQAISYSRNNWAELTRYLDDGRLEIDNNATERCIRPFALGRKNWLFMGNPKSAQAAANIYSLIETCKSHNVNSYNYLKDVCEKLADPKIDLSTLISLLPYNWKAPENKPNEKPAPKN